MTEVFSSPTRDPGQPYEAEIVIPSGGIASVEFGIAGNAAGQRSDRLFPIVDPIYTPDEIRPDPKQALREIDRSRQVLALFLITVVCALAIAVALSRADTLAPHRRAV